MNTGTTIVDGTTQIQVPASLVTGNGLDPEAATREFDGRSDPAGRRIEGRESSVESKYRKKRGRPTEISNELKQRALEAQHGKERAQILYRTKHSSPQQVKNVPAILRNYLKRLSTYR